MAAEIAHAVITKLLDTDIPVENIIAYMNESIMAGHP